jgi:predicted DNA-binding transcriptional regulator YafY
MPRTARLLDLISALGQRPRPLATLARDFGVSERTLYRDLAELQGLYVPIVRDERGYRLVEGTTTRPLPLSSEERAVLRLALANPSLKRNPAYRRRLEGIEGKLDTLARATDESPAGLALAGPDRSGEVGAEIVEQLERAIKRRLSVRVVYRSLSGSGSTARGIDPWAVVHRASAWYLLGRCHVHAEPRTFRLDRIQSVETTTPAPPHPANFDLETYLRDTWGIWRGDQLWAITLEFAASLAPLLEHAHHHNGETVTTREDGSVLYQVNLSHLEEIARWVVGFGGRCRVVAPAELRARVREIAVGALAAMGVTETDRGDV